MHNQRREIYRGKIIALYLEQAELPNGARADFEIVDHPGGAAAVALDRENRVCHVLPGLPWGHKSYKERLDTLEKRQKALEKNWPAYPNEDDSAKMCREYSFLRATIERVIQDVVFNGVVQRYRDWIRVDHLDGVVGFTAPEYQEIVRLHKACCDVVDAHDHSSAKNAPVPNAQQLGKDIADLKAVVEAIKARRKQGTTTAVPATSP